MKAFLIFATFLLISCGPAWKLRKAEKLIKEAELQGAKWHVDTVYQTKVIPGDSVKLIVPVDRFLTIRDTVLVQGPARLHITRLYDTLRIQATCDTIKIKTPISVIRTIVAPKTPDRFWKGFGMGSASILVLLILYGVARLLRWLQ